jgi:hypothetical protein
MRYLHPDVLDNGPAHIRANAIRALVLPFYTTNYSQAVASALVTATIAPSDFTLSNEGTGRKMVFGGVTEQATGGIALSNNVHIAYTDGSARLLWVEGVQPSVIIAGQNYKLPVQTLISPQPQEQ